jgi:glycosyltransferase involved in cell wall biosynthesis
VKIAVVSCVFPPEPVVSSRTSFDVARGLTERGHEVTVVAPFPNRPGGKLYAGYRRSLFRREVVSDGFRIVRCASLFSRRSSLLSRLAENVSFGITSALALLVLPKPAVIYANTWPIFGAAMIAMVGRVRHIPLVISVQDLYPESLLSQRRRGSGVLGRMLLAVDRRVARGAAAIVVISEHFSERYQQTRGVEAARVHVVPNWLPAEGTDEIPGAAESCRDRNGIPRDTFLLVYGGNVGVSANVENVIVAFRDLDDLPGVHLLVAGEGASLDSCRRLAAEIAPQRIHFESPWIDTMGVLHAGDAVVLPTHSAQSAASVPSKLISYLLSARAVLAVALPDSDTARTIRMSGAGVMVEPDNPPALAKAIRGIVGHSGEERRRMGNAGRAWAMANVTAEVCLPQLLRIVEEEGR